jgi:hypothetical protein
MNKKILSLVYWVLCKIILVAQTTTIGDQSPILHGVNNSVRYYNEESLSINIPDAVVPLLAGMLIINEADPYSSQFQFAINAWLDKYTYLQGKIENISNINVKERASKFLAEGNFPEVELLLSENSRYDDLISYFPSSYQTSGAQSPILVGDNSTVLYVVRKVIEYKLPESLTHNLIDRLYSQDQKIKDLRIRVADRDLAIESWVTQYRSLELELRNSPDSVNQAAWHYFHAGKLDSALMVIGRVQSSEKSLGRISLLKARIQMLKFDYDNYDQSLSQVLKNLQIASLLESENPDVLFTYAVFMFEFSSDVIKKVEVLENTYQNLPEDSLSKKLRIALYLADIYIDFQQNIKADRYLREAKKLLVKGSAEVNELQNSFLTQLTFSRLHLSMGEYEQALAHSDSALLAYTHLPEPQNKYEKLWYVARLNRIMAANPEVPITSKLSEYGSVLDEFHTKLERNASNDLFLSERFTFIAHRYFSAGNLREAKRYVTKNEDLIKTYINPSNQLFFHLYFNNWLSLIDIHSSFSDYSEWGITLQEMDTRLSKWSDFNDFGVYKIRLLFEYGRFFFITKKYDLALENHQKCLDSLLRILPSNPESFAYHTAQCIDYLGNCYAALHKPRQGVEYLRTQLDQINKIQSLDQKNYTLAKIKIYRQIGNLFQLNGQMDSAQVQIQLAMIEAEMRLSASSEIFLSEFITLSIDYASSYVNLDNKRAIEIVENAKSKTNSYIEINTHLRQGYLPHLAHIAWFTAYVLSISRELQKSRQVYSEAYQIYSEIEYPSQDVNAMFAAFLSAYCEFLDNANYLFPKLSRKDQNELAALKCLYAAEGLDKWGAVPDNHNKVEAIKRLNYFLRTCD